MKTERIKEVEAFNKWWSPCKAVGIAVYTQRRKDFISGFRAAERLAKIEALESAKVRAYALLDDMIAELKEEGE